MRSVILVGVALAVMTLSVYWQAGDHEFLNFDDNIYVTENSHVARGLTGENITWAFTSFQASNWHPITWLSHMMDVELYGMEPRGHHLTSVVLHTVSVILLFPLLFMLTGALWQSAFVAALFALHPLHVESVAWVAERKDVLSAFFFFLTLLFYAAYVKKRQTVPYLLSLFSFALGLMSKPMLVTVPAVLLLLDFWPLDRLGLKREEKGEGCPGSALVPLLLEKVPFIFLSLCSSAVTIYAQQKGGAVKELAAAPLALRIENAVTAYAAYIVKTLWPRHFSIFYPFPSSIPLWQVVCSAVALLLVSAAFILGARRRPYLAVGWSWFLVTLLPVIGLIQVGNQSMANRYTYLPIIGLFIMAAWGVPDLLRNLPYRKEALALMAGVVIIASVALTWRQLGFWRDNVSLYRHAIKVTTGNYLAHFNLGVALDNEGDLNGAIAEFRDAIKTNPKLVEAYADLGEALTSEGNLDGAITEYHDALAINPDFFVAHCNLGVVLARKGDLDGAIEEYRKALRLNPNSLETHLWLGNALALKGNLDGAIKEFREDLAIDPNFKQAQTNLEIALSRMGGG